MRRTPVLSAIAWEAHEYHQPPYGSCVPVASQGGTHEVHRAHRVRARACRRVRQRRDLYADAKCRAGGDYFDVAQSLHVAYPYPYPNAYANADAHGGGRSARSGYAASEDFACCNGPRCLVLSAQQWRKLLRAR